MKVLTTIILTFSRLAVAVALLAGGMTGFAATTTSIATIESATTDGTASSSVFQLSLTSGQLANALTTASDIELSVFIAPQESHRGLVGDVYSVVIADGEFFKLTQDGSYSPWDGSIEDLTPFVTNQILTSTNSFTLLDGKMAASGSYLYFVAYGVEGESRLLFTPDPAQFAVSESSSPPDDSESKAAETFKAELETAVVQAKCILCHVEGGLARNSSLQFQRTNIASALNNFAALSAFVEEKGADLLLAKITGGEGHAGGMQLSQDSDGYQAFERVLAEINTLENPTYYAFNGAGDGAGARQASFLTEVALEPLAATLRRATLLLQGRVPTEKEKSSVTTEEELRTSLYNLMKGKNFREFIVNGVNDRLLIEGASAGPHTITSPNLFKAYTQRIEYELDGDKTNDGYFFHEVQKPAKRAAGELVAYIIENEKPYSEILTAEYTMMNPAMNEWLEGTAIFSDSDDREDFKPSRISGFYQYSSLKLIENRPASRSILEVTGPAQKNYPHIGILSDAGFLARYPTTATNRNRARARWVFYHFLGIDIEKSSQRPTDELALSDRNNPTMNNPNCAVCHALLDPVAGAFQNWSEYNMYRNGGNDALDRFYKYPEDGSESLYEIGDLWYRDMRNPGIYDQEIEDRDNTLLELAEIIVKEPAFLSASSKFWWEPVFGKPMIEKPAVESDQGYAAKYAAYQAQQIAVDKFANALAIRMNAKDMLVEMFMSPWFASEAVTSYAFNAAHNEAELGNKQLLSPEQLERKTRSLTGVAWRSHYGASSGAYYSKYDTFAVLFGGIDSLSVTSRSTRLTPLMTTVLMTHATEVACPAVVRQFATPTSDRSLFKYVEESTLPLKLSGSNFTLRSEDRADLEVITIAADLDRGPKTISLEFMNPYCDYDGESCIEQRVLFLESFNLTSKDAGLIQIRANDPRIRISNTCYVDWEGYVRFSTFCSAEIDLNIDKPGSYSIDAIVSAQLAPTLGGYVEAVLSVHESVEILESKTPNAIAIKNQISELFRSLHGTDHSASSDAVAQVYEIFVAALFKEKELNQRLFYQCNLGRDGLFYDDNLTSEEIESFRNSEPGQEWFTEDWLARRTFEDSFKTDPYGTKYAWTAVMAYMLSHYDYLHE